MESLQNDRRRYRHLSRYLWVSLTVCLFLAACGESDKTGEIYTQWDIAGGCASSMTGSQRRNANGQPADFCDHVDGDWLWVTYVADWCSASRSQAPHVARLAGHAKQNVAVFMVLTSAADPFVPARIGDAQTWAGAYGLPYTHVLYDSEMDTRTIPQHLIVGPDGKTWYRYIGNLESTEMVALLDDFASGRRRPDVRQLPMR